MTVSYGNSGGGFGSGTSVWDYLNQLQAQQQNQQLQEQQNQAQFQAMLQGLQPQTTPPLTQGQPPTQTQPTDQQTNQKQHKDTDWQKVLENFAWGLTAGSLSKNIGIGLLGGLYGPTLYKMVMEKAGKDGKNKKQTTTQNPTQANKGLASAIQPETTPQPTTDQTAPTTTTPTVTVDDLGLQIPILPGIESYLDRYFKLYGNNAWNAQTTNAAPQFNISPQGYMPNTFLR